ncbi:AraC family transcriptional regulator [Streptomyces sp. AK02-01A]|uniref:AraC family transcriptional regulator n=1 Tax=Streptomyces sp. AK02-01A TaxID=3028648 RepID=UPI0029ACB329|nr:AraC family transcriptional regulator [Streptomyces sp. AK02-01A]MDX3853130.1 AraC family transcriptional regulator [Streptomyces sp. AK02-01A]
MRLITENEVLPGRDALLLVENLRLEQGLRAHSHGFAALTFVRSGQARQHTEHGPSDLSPGRVVVIGPGSWHSYEPRGQMCVSNLYIGMTLLRAAGGAMPHLPALAPVLCANPGQAHLDVMTLDVADDALESCISVVDSLSRGTTTNLLGCLARLFDILSFIAPRPVPAPAPGHGPGRDQSLTAAPKTWHGTGQTHAARAVSLLNERLASPWTLAALARQVRISPSQLARRFSAEFGISPMAYLRRARAEHMAYLLESTTMPVFAACRAVGWHDANYGARRFRAHWGLSPSQYRAVSAGNTPAAQDGPGNPACHTVSPSAVWQARSRHGRS